MNRQPTTHARIVPAPGDAPPPLVVRTDADLGLLALGECEAGGADGEAAVHLALNSVSRHLELHQAELQRYREAPADALRARLLEALGEAVRRASQELFVFARRRGTSLGVGLDLLLWLPGEILVAHVGAGGVYLVRRDLLHRLARGRRPGPSQAPLLSSRWTQAESEPHLLGRDSQIEVETVCVEVWPGDHVALLSRALAATIEDADIRTLLACLDPEQATRGLVHMARERGAQGALGAFLARVPGDSAEARDHVMALLPVLARMPLLAWCTREELLDVAAVARPRRLADGERVFTEGQPGTELFLLVQGEVSVVSAGTGIARFGPGSTFGEMAMLDQPLRSATVDALSDIELLVIEREAFFALLKGNTTLAVKLLWNLLVDVSGHLRRTTSQMSGLVSGTGSADPDEDPTTMRPRRRGAGARPLDPDDDLPTLRLRRRRG